jgi:putative flavoprotein involved in K+ transport
MIAPPGTAGMAPSGNQQGAVIMSETISTVVIGAGQAGLAVSHCLAARDIEHVVLERGRVAERWQSERWDSLRLLTPNWMTRLPGFRYQAPDPDGFMTADQTARFFARYALSFDAPVREHAEVIDVSHHGDRFTVTTTTGRFVADNVVISTGWCDRPAIPGSASGLSSRIHQVVPTSYRNPHQLPQGGVLVVGASATGVQLAAELSQSGREVIMAVGNHQRMPRTYRGMDCFWWLDQLGVWERTVDQVDDVWGARREPALQVVGRPDHATLDLPVLQRLGVVLTGRFAGADGTRAYFDRDLAATTAAADGRLTNMLARIDRAIERCGLSSEVLPADAIEPVRPVPQPDSIDLIELGIRNVVWATGYRRHYPWLRLPILDQRGEIAQYRGVTPVPGAYVLGQRFQHYRNSNFIDGVGRDAAYVADHLAARLHGPASTALSDHIGGLS